MSRADRLALVALLVIAVLVFWAVFGQIVLRALRG